MYNILDMSYGFEVFIILVFYCLCLAGGVWGAILAWRRRNRAFLFLALFFLVDALWRAPGDYETVFSPRPKTVPTFKTYQVWNWNMRERVRDFYVPFAELLVLLAMARFGRRSGGKDPVR